ncbi:50S ribosomal protein L24e [Candidatus Woesearchaeota archaeon]|nr:50S ribosomal protein L24e [Candidatus Woesearchaeota archaeon]
MQCTFCGQDIERGTGKIFVQNDGRVMYFCSRKCEKNILKLHRKARETRWTKSFQKEAKGEGMRQKKEKGDNVQ